ncbi:spermidine synthase [Portibacter marinus]|uniref:spermidine synthase n=1 Tax=Portibacter marinus TaxID=2898660 RepID=UPI001F46696B|nr:hypothetical protein [Portibacter marinus]
MKQPWWKRMLSHFSDIHIESVDSSVNPELYVCLSKGRYQLCVKNAIYSFEDKYDNFWDTFAMLDLGDFIGKDILILGFGLGSIPKMLEMKGLKAHFTGVEYDEQIIYLFHKYMADKIEAPLEIIQADAEIFMKLNERKYDMIAMDVFVEDLIPNQFLQPAFLTDLKNGLSDNGLLIWNHLYHYEKDRKAADNFFEDTFQKIFTNASFIQTSGNKMLLNKKIVPSQAK